MWMLGPLGFSAPGLLIGLLALPILWLILRAIPPAPIRRRFPGVVLLLGLRDEESQSDRTPWWLLLLRLLAAAAVIVGFAGPVLNPDAPRGGSGPLLLLADGSWADAADWAARQAKLAALVDEAGQAGRPVALALLTDLPAEGPSFQAARDVAERVAGLEPRAWEPDRAGLGGWLGQSDESFETIWLSDGLEREGRSAVLAELQKHGTVTVVQAGQTVWGLPPVAPGTSGALVSARRSPAPGEASIEVAAIGPDPSGAERQLGAVALDFAAGEGAASTDLPMQSELRNRITRFEITGIRSAGAISLADDALRRREVALVASGADQEGLELLSPLHYLRQALDPSADVISGTLADILPANPDVIILADAVGFGDAETADLLAWIDRGGLLLRFAGPRLAASDAGRLDEDPLLPVRLRAGGRSIGGAMSWGEPKALAPFAEDSPFAGLEVPPDVTVRAQVLAQPDPTLAGRVIAQLADGTPLVTRKAHGQGQIVLFHTTANAEWSSLPLSGLFVRMLERLTVLSAAAAPDRDDLAGTTWMPERVLDAFGRLQDAQNLAGVSGERLAEGRPGPDMPPGLYRSDDRQLAVNVVGAETVLAPAIWPDDMRIEGMETRADRPLKGWLLAAAVALLALDALASLWLTGRLTGRLAGGGRMAAGALALTLGLWAAPQDVRAQDVDPAVLSAASRLTLAHVLTGDARVDEMAQAGLLGLSNTLWQRSSVEPTVPVGVDIERDELSVYPFLYWPVTGDEPLPSRQAYARLNSYLGSGGLILFDTRDADIADFGASTPEGRRLQAIARGLDIPPLEPIPADHVLTRSFYLLQEFPGRYTGRSIWLEAAPPDAELADGMPFRNLNDGVTPVVIGGNDWAAAWAVDAFGAPLVQIGRGSAGDRQREIALRFGVNLVMHVLTGNYKSDQVHVPALLDRLGQ